MQNVGCSNNAAAAAATANTQRAASAEKSLADERASYKLVNEYPNGLVI